MWNLKKFGNKIAFISEQNNEYSYNQLDKFSHHIKNKIKKRSLILLLNDNSIASVFFYIGLIQNNHLILLLNSKNKLSYIKKIIKLYDPDFICSPKSQSFFEKKKLLKIVTTFKHFYLIKRFNSKKKLINKNICLLVSTSGSTGSPKLIKQTFENIRINSKSIIEYLKINHRSTGISSLPLNYTFGNSVINTHLFVGAKNVITNRSVLEKNFWKIFVKNKVSILYGVPFIFEIICKLKIFKKNFKNLKIIAQAGGKLSEKIQLILSEYSKKYKKKFFIMYGQAEATTRISYLPHNLSGKKLNSIGKAISGGKIELIDKKNKIIKKQNKEGEIVYKGKNVCMGYSFSKNDLNKRDDWNGIIKTGDIGIKDKEGYFYIVGRIKRSVKIYGVSTNLDEIENILKNKFKNSELAVIGLENKIKIFFNNLKIKKKIIKFLLEKIEINESVINCVFIKKIPKLINGKLDYNSLSNSH